MALSSREPARRRQLANLKRGNNSQPGNTASLKHGGYAAIARDALERKQREVFDALALDAPLRGHDGDLPRHDGAIIALLAACMIRLESIATYLRDHGLIDDRTGQPRAVLEVEGRIRREAADLLDALGMTPRSRAKLGVDIARSVDLSTAMSEPDPEIRKALLQRAGVLDHDHVDRNDDHDDDHVDRGDGAGAA